MRALCLLLVVALMPFAPAQDFNSTYRCIIKGVQTLDKRGKLIKHKAMTSSLTGTMFSVDRETGKITADFYNNHSPTVLWNPAKSGDTRTAYLAEDVLVAAQGAVFSIFQVKDLGTKNNKPFVWYTSEATFTGMCK